MSGLARGEGSVTLSPARARKGAEAKASKREPASNLPRVEEW